MAVGVVLSLNHSSPSAAQSAWVIEGSAKAKVPKLGATPAGEGGAQCHCRSGGGDGMNEQDTVIP